MSWAPSSIQARPHNSWSSIALLVGSGIFLFLASTANAAGPAAGPAAGRMASMPGPSTAFNTATNPEANSSFSMMAAMALQSTLEGTSAKSTGRSSVSDIVSIMPRVWITQVNLAESAAFDSGAVIVPMYGGSITVTPPGTPNFSILATGFYGKGKGEARTDDTGFDLNSKIERTDIEILFRYHFPETQFVVFGGPRYVTFDTSYEFAEIPSFRVNLTSDIWVLEIGGGAFANLGETGRHRFFGNFTLGVAFEDFESKPTGEFGAFEEKTSNTTGTIDLNFGYEYLLVDWASLNFRYRMFNFFTTDDFFQADLTTIHGPEFGLALRF